MARSAPGEALDAAAAALAIELAPAARDALLAYAALVLRWQRVANLTGAPTATAFVREHVVDCLAVVPHLGAGALLDVGSGAGLPGVVIALARPQLEVTLLEPRGKRARFLRQAAIELGLARVSVVQARAQAYAPAVGYAQIISRAVGSLAGFVTSTTHLLANASARRYAMKSRVDAADLAAAEAAAGPAQIVRLAVPGKAQRSLVVFGGGGGAGPKALVP
ncbi:MAG: 16S rRNA (guanine(527)-N(7))-methyltransferase RsmG [Gammaproteobacteria bacterium]